MPLVDIKIKSFLHIFFLLFPCKCSAFRPILGFWEFFILKILFSTKFSLFFPHFVKKHFLRSILWFFAFSPPIFRCHFTKILLTAFMAIPLPHLPYLVVSLSYQKCLRRGSSLQRHPSSFSILYSIPSHAYSSNSPKHRPLPSAVYFCSPLSPNGFALIPDFLPPLFIAPAPLQFSPRICTDTAPDAG